MSPVMPPVLALDSATEACSVAVVMGAEVLASRHEMVGRGHANRLLPMVEEVLAQAGLSLAELGGIAFGKGPGSFTGVRVALSVAQGLAYGAGVQLLPVSGLQALALRAHALHGATAVLACLDARMGEVYVAGYECSGETEATLVGLEAVMAPEGVVERLSADPGRWYLAGPGAGAYPALREARHLAVGAEPGLWPDARDIARLGGLLLQRGAGVEPGAAQPAYLRNEVAHRSSGSA
ncbi:MAG: tRNA (adenosine(37)-N6)-threonylcarbamoyltransferase complex dimerization subunit type 1 TsaB [Steroidobacteraceae bacterium]